jgi:hypothetical protein
MSNTNGTNGTNGTWNTETASGTTTTTTTTTASLHPLLDFCHRIAYDPRALSAFLDGFNPAPSTALHEALHSGHFENVHNVLKDENPSLVSVPIEVEDLRLSDGSTNAGWVLSTLMDQINGWTPPPAPPPTPPTSP